MMHCTYEALEGGRPNYDACEPKLWEACCRADGTESRCTDLFALLYAAEMADGRGRRASMRDRRPITFHFFALRVSGIPESSIPQQRPSRHSTRSK